eukprot:COSAG06_NODE_10765_length_1620_cov_129.230112_5_plen_66_part_01
MRTENAFASPLFKIRSFCQDRLGTSNHRGEETCAEKKRGCLFFVSGDEEEDYLSIKRGDMLGVRQS